MSKYTAIVRKKLSSPMQLLREQIVGDCLDYGCGRGFDCDYLKIDGYDPNWRPTLSGNKKYDRIFCNFVLNVVSEKEQDEIISHITSLLKNGGKAFFTVRRDMKSNYIGRGCVQRLVYLDLPIHTLVAGRFCIYKMDKYE